MSRILRPALIQRSCRGAKVHFLIKHKFIPRGALVLPGDKSIAHRALILGALSCGKTTIDNFPLHDDSYATIQVLEALGVKIVRQQDKVFIYGCGMQGFRVPCQPLFAHNSGTTLRLMLGVLAGLDFRARITAWPGLKARPMSRVTKPLRLMGAKIQARIKHNEEYAPLTVRGGKLTGITYLPDIASAQVKSAILLAGLFAQGKTTVIERLPTRDHTERMLKAFGADIAIKNNRVTLKPGLELKSPGKIYIPGDVSSAAFFCVLAAIIPGSKVTLKGVGLNPGRTGAVKVLKRMGAKIKVKISPPSPSQEPAGDLIMQSSRLKGTTVSAREIPFLIDELPVLMVAACFARGKTVIQSAQELRVKETDRINSMVTNLRRMGADIRVAKKGRQEKITINGQGFLRGANLSSFGDHRSAMSLMVAAYAACGDSTIDDISCISKSFPGFLKVLKGLKGKLRGFNGR